MEEDLVPYAVAADNATAHLRSFSFGREVQQPALHGVVGLTEDLNDNRETVYVEYSCEERFYVLINDNS